LKGIQEGVISLLFCVGFYLFTALYISGDVEDILDQVLEWQD